MLFVGTSIIHPSTEGVFLLCNILDLLIYSYILTDDQAPVELLGMQVIDELIKDEVQYYKDIYKERGIKGLMESL